MPVTSMVALQLVVYLALLAVGATWRVMAWTVPVAVGCMVFALWLRGEPVGLLVWRRSAFRLGRRRRIRREAAASGGLLPDLFCGLQVRGGQTRFGQTFGVATWGTVAVAAVEIRQPLTGVVDASPAATMPVERILTRIRTAQIPVQSLAFVSTATGGQVPARPGRLEEVFASLDGGAPVTAVRTVVAIRLDPHRAQDAVAARGGGHQGLVATLATLTGLVETELRAEGLAAAALEPRAMVAHLRDGLFDDSDDGSWAEAWDHVSSGAMMHRSLVLASWDDRAAASLDPVMLWPGPGVVTSVEIFPRPSGRVATRAWVRHSRRDDAALTAAGAATVAGLRPMLRLAPADGHQLRALRATTILGSDHVPSS